MALLFAEVAEEFVAKKSHHNDEQGVVQEVFDTVDNANADDTTNETDSEFEQHRYDGLIPQQIFMTAVAGGCYEKYKEDIKNTKVGNKSIRRKNFQQIMRESFFYGANRFGNNFIA